IPGLAGLDRFVTDGLAQLRHVHLEELVRARRRVLAPQTVDERLYRDDTACVEQEPRKQRTRLPDRQWEALAVFDRLERPEQPEVGHRAPGIIARCRSATTGSGPGSARERPASSIARATRTVRRSCSSCCGRSG